MAPIQPDQRVRDAMSIYAGMVEVEKMCNEVDRIEYAKVQAGNIQHIPRERYNQLVSLHQTLLYDQYDFFFSCSHPDATPQLRQLPHKYGMRERIWKSGIHTFLEVLRHHLPESSEHMSTFLRIAYKVVCQLYETIPSHKATWIECLGDLSRYRMAVEERDAETKEIWTNRAREWYYAATDILPCVGRLYHHLAIVARKNPVEQLFFYIKSLTVDLIFTGTRESVLVLFQTVSGEMPRVGLITEVDYSFVQLHQTLFTKINLDKMGTDAFITLLTKALDCSSDPETPDFWGSRSTHMAICGIGSLYQYGAKEGIFRSFGDSNCTGGMSSASGLQPPPPPPPQAYEYAESVAGEPDVINRQFELARDLAMRTLETFLGCGIESAKVLHVQAWLVFIDFFTRHREGIMRCFVEAWMPWHQLVDYINFTFKLLDFSDHPTFPDIKGASATADDYALRGLVWASDYFPKTYFTDHSPESESDRSFEPSPRTQGAADNLEVRKKRVMYLASRICVVR